MVNEKVRVPLKRPRIYLRLESTTFSSRPCSGKLYAK